MLKYDVASVWSLGFHSSNDEKMWKTKILLCRTSTKLKLNQNIITKAKLFKSSLDILRILKNHVKDMVTYAIIHGFL